MEDALRTLRDRSLIKDEEILERIDENGDFTFRRSNNSSENKKSKN